MLNIYGHYVSQPSRAVLWALHMKGVPYKLHKVVPVTGDTITPAFLAKFPAGIAPALEDTTVTPAVHLTEAPAILLYLADKYQWSDLVPKDIAQRAKMHQWMHWGHTNLRPATTYYFRPAMLKVMGVAPEAATQPAGGLSAKASAKREQILTDSMEVMTWGALKDTKFLAGDELSLADLCAYSELDQIFYMKNAFPFEKWPAVVSWMQRMQALPHHDDIRRSLFKLLDTINANNSNNNGKL